MTRVAYFVHGRGRGHAARAWPVVRHLVSLGHEVDVFGGGDAIQTFGEFPRFVRTEVSRLAPSGFVPLVRRVRALDDHRERFDVVVTDGDLAGLAWGRRRGLPILALGHGPVFSIAEMDAKLPRRALLAERAKSLLHVQIADRIVGVHFTPARVVHPRALLARPDEPIAPVPRARGGPRVVAYFRYGDGAPYVRALAERSIPVRVFADSIGPLPPGIDRLAPGPDFQSAFADATHVVGSAGSNLLTECLYADKPFLALHRSGDAEQTLNALLAAHAGAAVAAPFGSDAREEIERLLRLELPTPSPGARLRDALEPVSLVVAAELARLVG